MSLAGNDASTPVEAPPLPRFPVELEGFSGSLEELVIRAQRGDIDLATIPVAEITALYRREIRSGERSTDLLDIADFLALASRLVALKAQSALPDPNADSLEVDEVADPATDAGRRLAEYRLYKAAADALLAEAAEEGARSFLSLVVPDVIPVERLTIAPERLAAAFRTVLERLAAIQPIPVGFVTFSVAEMAARIRGRLNEQLSFDFEEIFTGVTSRLEAVALFLGLLELLREGAATVVQREPTGPITVTSGD